MRKPVIGLISLFFVLSLTSAHSQKAGDELIPSPIGMEAALPGEEISPYTEELFPPEGVPPELEDASFAPADYVLGPGDGVVVNIWGKVNATHRLTVLPDGKIFIPMAVRSQLGSLPIERCAAIGDLRASGLTVEELQKKIAKKVANLYQGVEVSVSLRALRKIRVSVLGQVKRPGVYVATRLYRVSDVLRKASGPTNLGSLRKVEIQRGEESVAVVDLYSFLLKADKTQNPYVMSQDIIYVPVGEIKVRIYGRVRRPGVYELKPGEKLSDLITMAEGLDPRAAMKSIKIYNVATPDQLREVDTYKVWVERDLSSDIVLGNGDVVVIPTEAYTITVVGHVIKGGTFLYEPGTTFSYYLGLAGGYGERANTGSVRITRWGGDEVKWKKGVPIEPGDTIVIGGMEIKGWRDYLNVSLQAATLFFIIWQVTR